MISREQIESILKINGLSPSSPDETIRSVLLSARYNQDEVDTALMVLREDARTKQIRVDGLHKIFRSDESLAPKEISQLLGIEVDGSKFVRPEQVHKDSTTLHYMVIWGLSLVLALSGLLVYMYVTKVGFFHASLQSDNSVAAARWE